MIFIAIPSLNFCGGAEAVTLMLIDLLRDKGYDVRLKSVDKPNWRKIERILGYNIDVDEHYLIEKDITEDLDLMSVLRLVRTYKKILEDRNDLLVNMYGDLDIYLDKGDIVYINGIPFSIIDADKAPIYMKGIIHSIYKVFTKNKSPNTLITNSYYMRERIRERLGLESSVIHPPPTIRDIPVADKEDMILTITRIARGKKLERVLQIAELLKDRRFVIFGRMYDQVYYEELLNKSREISNVTFLINKSRNLMLDHLSKARILLHTMDNEGYGISIIEGMLARCIPIIPRNGGPWIDILDKRDGVYGYSYNSIEEAAKKIEIAMGNNSIANNAYEKALLLSREFYEQFPKVIDSMV